MESVSIEIPEYVFEAIVKNGRLKLMVNEEYKPKIIFDLHKKYMIRNHTNETLVLHFKNKSTEDVWFLTGNNYVTVNKRFAGRYYIDGDEKSGGKIYKPLKIDRLEFSEIGLPSFIKKWKDKHNTKKVSDDDKKLIDLGKKYKITPRTGRSDAFKIARKASWKDIKEMWRQYRSGNLK